MWPAIKLVIETHKIDEPMTEIEPRPFGGFRVSHPTKKFELTARDLKVHRYYRRAALLGDEPEFSTSIHGTAVADWDSVCVLGTEQRSKEFHLTINSDKDIGKSWERMKANDLTLRKGEGDPEQRRIRDLQHSRFDKSPPTATLFYHQGHWSLECELPVAALEQLSNDLASSLVNTVYIQIAWPFGLIDAQTGSWGFFPDGELRGHVSSFRWSLLSDAPVSSRAG